ncbi:bifunctional phosphoribosylaminoimidazolecarboxamide formyltransferase/IMP cyclohydrolase [Prosthecomicrobium pneumaticum]|uniref:Bifunctional purine biosynthesis protein PurH n=1 Tax=Prosthecomicrobium pneumaticum TaxID=81895 RepID=A0A7W9FM20_9HYPH|nr:bifunctional phosphoribosylaminoimidazolecarboxamide formyltransferase/IMP cyclohydrolase [Prosthecomicrobium pneumaticum]MBB5753136.1 phosphoribosylaminoimidazolecarboxamide formyltransferase/IMP cyclohydrolase [Prosthecomicrobium pneumaticum]
MVEWFRFPMPPPPAAILSVADKRGLDEIAAALSAKGVTLFATEGTAAHLRAAGLAVFDLADLTGMPPLLGGRVKALHPAVFAGLMAHEDETAALEAMGSRPIDYLIAGVTPLDAGDRLERMDIGGPAMIRAAVKTHRRVTVATEPEDYAPIIAALRAAGRVGNALRRELAARALARLAAADAAAARALAAQADPQGEAPLAPPLLVRATRLRYGENPHQRATLWRTATWGACAAGATLLQGRAPSYTNVLDADAAFALAARFARPAAVIVKHAGPAGAALGADTQAAYRRALAADPESAYGGTAGFNRPVGGDLMATILETFTEAVVAPHFTAAARAAAAKRPAMRLLETGYGPHGEAEPEVRSVTGGLLVQTADRQRIGRDDLVRVTKRAPGEAEIEDMLFALEVVRAVRSNAAVVARDGATVGIGGGQPSRVGAVALAVRGLAKIGDTGAVLASDAYFPFPDSVEAAAAAGITAIVQQGGARRDADTIAAADRLGLAMVFCGLRLFRH